MIEYEYVRCHMDNAQGFLNDRAKGGWTVQMFARVGSQIDILFTRERGA